MRKTASGGQNFHVVWEIDVAEYIFSEIFTTRSRINVLTAHTETLSPQRSPKWRRAPEITTSLYENGCAEFKYDVRF